MSSIVYAAEKKEIAVSVDCPENLIISHDSKWTSEALFNLLEMCIRDRLCKEQGAGLLCMEMISAKALQYKNKNTKALLAIHPEAVSYTHLRSRCLVR